MNRRPIRLRSILLRLYRSPWTVIPVGLLAILFIFWEVRTAELNDFRARFETSATSRATRVIQEMEESLSIMRALTEFVQRAQSLSGKDFRTMAAPFLKARKDIKGVCWVPVGGNVLETGPPAHVSGRPETKAPGPANQSDLPVSRQSYYPVLYAEPASSGPDIGFDLGSDPALLSALERSRDTGVPVATPWMGHHNRNDSLEILLLFPVYREGSVPDKMEVRRAALRGFVFAILRLDHILIDLFDTALPGGLSVEFLDFHDDAQGRKLYERSTSTSGEKGSWVSVLLPVHPPLVYRTTFAGREWGIRATPSVVYSRKFYRLSHWLVLPIGAVLTFLIALYRRSILMQWSRMERAVAERTAELREHEHNLEQLVKERTESLSWKTAFLEAIANASRDGVIVIDSQGKETFRNERAAGLWEAPPLTRSDDGSPDVTLFLDHVKGPPQFKEDVFSVSGRADVCLRHEIELLDGTILDTYSSPVLGKDDVYYGRIWMFHDVTERRSAEEALRRSEATLRSVISASPVGIALVGADRTIVWASDAMHAITGYRRGGTNDRNPRRLYETDEEFARVREAMYGDRGAGARGMIDTQWLREDGTVVDVSLGAVPIDPENPTSDLVIAAVDITERKRSEETLRDSENKFRDLAEKSVLGISLVQDGFYKFVNARFAEIHGLTIDEMMDRPATSERVHPEDRERVERYVSESPDRGHRPIEFRVVTGNGETRTLLAYVSSTTYRMKPALIATLLDITEQRQAEESLRENEVLLSYATDLAKIVYWEFDEASGEFTFNDAFYSFCGTTAEQEGGYRMRREEYMRAFVHPDDAIEVKRRSSENRKHADSSEPSEHRVIRRDGSVIHIVTRTRYFRDAEGKVLRTIGANQDITEQKRVEEALTWKTAFLEAQMNSSLDGILVVDGHGRTILRNQRLIEMWKLPEHIIEGGDNRQDFGHALSMTRNPDALKEKIVFLHNNPGATSRDEIDLEDGTVLDTYSCPVLGKDGTYYGRIWTFRDVTELKHYWEMLENLSNTDGLTDLANRRRFDEFLNREWRRALRDRSPLSLIMMDIDCFKEFNDNYGHLAGDDCLRQVARILNEVMQRPGDLAARYGGEEFACILPNTDSDGAVVLADKVRARMKVANMPHFFSPIADHVTLSFGVATLIPEVGQMPLEVVQLADTLLYSAKREGRDQVRVGYRRSGPGKLGQSGRPLQ